MHLIFKKSTPNLVIPNYLYAHSNLLKSSRDQLGKKQMKTSGNISFYKIKLKTQHKMFVLTIHSFSTRKYFPNAYYGSGMGSILLDNVRCSGSENDIAECGSNGWGKTDCSHGEDVGVHCGE